MLGVSPESYLVQLDDVLVTQLLQHLRFLAQPVVQLRARGNLDDILAIASCDEQGDRRRPSTQPTRHGEAALQAIPGARLERIDFCRPDS